MKNKITLFIVLFGFISVFSQETQNKNTTICWDVSASMEQRDLEKDFSVLEKVFERNKDQDVQLILFGIQVTEKQYTVSNGDWYQLKNDLENVAYDGVTIYSNLDGKIKNPNVYIFTDGKKVLSKDRLSLSEKSYLINSNADRDVEFLKRTALLNKSRLMDFAAVLPENVKQIGVKNKSIEPKNEALLMGTIYIDNIPASNVKVAIKGVSDSFLSDALGNFSLDAQVGDTLVVTSRDKKTLKVIPIVAMAHTNIFLDANIVSLEEVVVIEKKLQKLEEVLTGYGLQKKESIGYVVSEVDDEDISEITTTIGDAINTKVPGLEIPGQNAWERAAGGLGAAKIRGSGTINMNTNALVVIDGTPMKRSENTSVGGVFNSTNANVDFIDPNNIANITVLKGLAATNAYGGEGRGGVILITTKTAVHGTNQSKKPVDRALLRNNIYDEGETKKSNISPVLQVLSKSASEEDAYNTYLALKNLNKTNTKFYIEAFDYFKIKNPQIAKSVISNILEFKTADIESLRMVVLALSTVGDYENMIKLNEEIIKRVPTDVNAYFDNAVAKRALGKHQEALDELLALVNGNYFSINATGITKTLDREIKNLVFKHKNNLNLTNLNSKYLNNLRYKVRLVFEWNIPGAEFELQFVNPQKRFFNWEHTNTAIKNRMQDEIQNGYRIEEYEFYGDVVGEWIINAKYLGDIAQENIPLKLKCTIYQDFGYPSESKKEVLVHFYNTDEKKNIRTIVVK